MAVSISRAVAFHLMKRFVAFLSQVLILVLCQIQLSGCTSIRMLPALPKPHIRHKGEKLLLTHQAVPPRIPCFIPWADGSHAALAKPHFVSEKLQLQCLFLCRCRNPKWMEENVIGIGSCFVWTLDRSLWKTWEEHKGQRRAKKTCQKESSGQESGHQGGDQGWGCISEG